MSGASPSRAAVFTSSPQSVEIYERGAWWPGSMLGWRHDNSGTCQAWVRVEFAGVVEDAWVDLTLLRLPESRADRHLTLARQPKGAAAVTRSDARSESVSRPSDVTQTQHLPLVREGAAPAVGRRVPPTGGRRRAPETGEMPAPAAPPAAPAAVESRPLGRHRAPAPAPEDAGRHRAADTGMLSAVPSGPGSAAADRWPALPTRSELPPAGPVLRAAPARAHVDHELLTRPMRLEDGVGSARPSRRDSLTGV